jgi:hypothetical protein
MNSCLRQLFWPENLDLGQNNNNCCVCDVAADVELNLHIAWYTVYTRAKRAINDRFSDS